MLATGLEAHAARGSFYAQEPVIERFLEEQGVLKNIMSIFCFM